MTGVPEEHRELAPKSLGFAVIVVSSSRYAAYKRGLEVGDESGRRAVELIKSRRHRVEHYSIVPDDKMAILRTVLEALSKSEVDAVVTIGGTGLSATDVTIESLRPLFDKEIEGFGEVFRYLSYGQVGPACYLSRATAGVVGGKVVYCIPGSPDAVELALKELILPEAPHAVYIARRDLEAGERG